MAAAIRARQLGIDRIDLIDKAPGVTDKVCGDGLTPPALEALSTLGISYDDLENAGANEIRNSVHLGTVEHTIRYAPKTFVTLRRKTLHTLMHEAARAAGVSIRYSTPYTPEMSGDVVIDASGCQRKRQRSDRKFPVGISGQISGASSLPEDSVFFIHHESLPGGYYWAFPLGNNVWNVGLWLSQPSGQMKALYNAFNSEFLKKHFSHATEVRKPRGARLGTIAGLPAITDTAIACGDAAGRCDKESGEGVSFAMLDGIRAVDQYCANQFT